MVASPSIFLIAFPAGDGGGCTDAASSADAAIATTRLSAVVYTHLYIPPLGSLERTSLSLFFSLWMSLEDTSLSRVRRLEDSRNIHLSQVDLLSLSSHQVSTVVDDQQVLALLSRTPPPLEPLSSPLDFFSSLFIIIIIIILGGEPPLVTCCVESSPPDRILNLLLGWLL
jgi:hypothetical protein